MLENLVEADERRRKATVRPSSVGYLRVLAQRVQRGLRGVGREAAGSRAWARTVNSARRRVVYFVWRITGEVY